MFETCIQHLFKTWRDMRASLNDLDKVIDVTKEQILSALSHKPQKLEAFKRYLPTYSQITDLWREANKKRGEEDSEAIKALRDILRPDLMNLIQRQRLNFICEGTRFLKQKKAGGSKFTFVKLSPNRKTLCFGDWSDHESVPEIENLDGKLPVCDIKALVTGSECLTISNAMTSTNNKDTASRRGRDQDIEKHLTIMSESANLELIAPDAKSFDYWCDAINALLRNDMTSSRMSSDLETLMGPEIRLRLLDIEGVALPEKAPPIPPPPPSYDFVV